jgi:hypothetical protein
MRQSGEESAGDNIGETQNLPEKLSERLTLVHAAVIRSSADGGEELAVLIFRIVDNLLFAYAARHMLCGTNRELTSLETISFLILIFLYVYCTTIQHIKNKNSTFLFVSSNFSAAKQNSNIFDLSSCTTTNQNSTSTEPVVLCAGSIRSILNQCETES